MKRILCVLLAMLMILSAGCSADEEVIDNSAVLGSVNENSGTDRIEINPIESSSLPETESSETSSEETTSSESSESTPETSASSSDNSKPNTSSSSISTSSISSAAESSESVSEFSASSKSEPQNTEVSAPKGEIRAVWISYLEYQTVLQGKSHDVRYVICV